MIKLADKRIKAVIIIYFIFSENREKHEHIKVNKILIYDTRKSINND